MKPLPQLTDFEIPQSQQNEGLLLCEIISSPSTIMEVRKIVSRQMFADYENQKLWDLINSKFDHRETIDLTTIFPLAERKHFMENILCHQGACGLESAILSHAESLRDTYIKRLTYFNAVKTLQMIQSGAPSLSILEGNKKLQEEIKGQFRSESTKTLTRVINELADDLEKGANTHIGTGIQFLDFLTYGGFVGGNLVVLAARPSVGKTSFAIQMALNAARNGRKVCFLSLEMTAKEIAQRLLVSSGEITPYQIATREMEWMQFEKAAQKTSSENFFIEDSVGTLSEIRTKIQMLHQEGKCDIAYIDYLGLIALSGTSKQSVVQQISEITRELKILAKQLNIPIVVLCQLNRSSASERRSPQLYDLRDSGSIEQDADTVLMLERPSDLGEERENKIDMWVRKNRGGKAGEVCIHLKGDENYTNFVSI